MGKFTLRPNEQIILEGKAHYFKTTLNNRPGNAILTSHRFVFCGFSRTIMLLIGPLGSYLAKSRNQLFEIALSDIRSIESHKRGLGHNWVVTTATGESYGLQFLSGASQWVELLQQTTQSVNQP